MNNYELIYKLMRKKNFLSFKNLSMNNHSSKINNNFKKSSATQNNNNNKIVQYNNSSNPNRISNINNNIYLNLYNKFNNTTSLKKNSFSPKQIISNRINTCKTYKEKKSININILQAPQSSSNKNRKNNILDNSSLVNSMNFIDNHGQINIRLNLNKFTNNNFSNFCNNIDIEEKMKEKDLKISQLKNELLKSQEIINYFQTNNNLELNKFNLTNNLKEKNLGLLTKSSESVDKILKTAFNGYTSNNIINKKNKKNYKNSFLKSFGNKNIIDILQRPKSKEKNAQKKSERGNDKNKRNIYSGHHNKKQSDYLKLFLPLYNLHSEKTKFKSYSNDKKNLKDKSNINNDNVNKTENNCHKQLNEISIDNIDKKSEDFINITHKCEELKGRTYKLLNKYILLGERIKSNNQINIKA